MEILTPERLAELDIHIFLEVYEIKNEQGEKLDFKDHAYLWDLYSDFSPHQAIEKAAQIGFSTLAIIKSMWLAKTKKMDMIYTLPTYGDVHDFVTSKTNRIIEQNPILKEWVKDKDTIDQKRIGESVIYNRGTWSERQALMIASDLNVHDEVDRSNLKVVDQYYSRLQHSKYAWQWLFSNPSVPDLGVDKLYNRSDQRHWFIKCEHCGWQQYLTMSNIISHDESKDDQWFFACTKCKKELDRHRGEWVARWPSRTEVRGYWISLLMAPRTSANTIKLLQRTKAPDYFENFVMGKPYIGSGNVVSRDVILRNLTDAVNKQDGRIVIGVDPGVDIRYVIGNREGIFYYGQCKDYLELDNIMKRWDRTVMVIDQGGDIIGSRSLREKYKNRVFLAYYRHDRASDEFFSWDKENTQVTIDRNRTIQLVIDEFTDRRIPLFGNETDWNDYWLHWSHIYRVSEENSLGQQVSKWQRTDRDDWVHATIYWRAGIDRFMQGEGTIIDISSNIGELGYTASADGKHLLRPTRTYIGQ